MTTAKSFFLFLINFLFLTLQNNSYANDEKIKIIAEETHIRSFYEEPNNDKKGDKKDQPENKEAKKIEENTTAQPQTAKIVGSEIEIITKIFTKLKIPFEIQLVHWTQTLPMMISGEADIAVGIEKKSKFDKYVNFTRTPTYTKNYSFYGLANESRTSNIMTFEDALSHNYTVGIIVGFTYPKVFWDAYPFQNKQLNTHLIEGKDIRANIIKLKERKIDLMIADRERTDIILKKIGADETIFQYKNLLYWKEFFLVFSKKLKQEKFELLKGKIDRELYKMTESEEINEINQSWIKKGT